METEDDNVHQIIPNELTEELINRYGIQSRIIPQESDNKEIFIPPMFKEVILKMCPEIVDIVPNGYREQSMYNPMDFSPVYNYLVGVDLYFNEYNGMKKSKDAYGKEFNDYFKMTYSDMDFISFHVRSFIFPPERTNKDKFFELFGVVE